MVLTCDMQADCAEAVTMLDQKGYAYCTNHGLDRRYSGVPCRKLQPWELRKLQKGEGLRRY